MLQYLLGFIFVLAACLATQSLGLKSFGGSTTKSESNYFSTVGRVQAQADGEAKMLLLGSSLTGRLADRAAPIPGIGNIGCDGGSAMVTLRAIDSGRLAPAPIIVIEANTLAYDLDGRGQEIEKAIDSEWFDVGRKAKPLSATARPTAIAYSWLMKKKDGAPISTEVGLPISTRPSILTGQVELSANEQAFVTSTCELLTRLQAKGSKLLLVMLPPGETEGSLEQRIARAVAIQSAQPYWDLSALPEDAANFTDGRHMDAETAAKTMRTLSQELE